MEAISAYLTAQRKQAIAALRSPEKIAKVSADELEALFADLPDADRKKLVAELLPYLQDVAVAGVEVSLADLGVDMTELLSQASEEAIAWAEQRAANLVGMRVLEDGTIVPNPNSQWAIDETTRGGIRDLVEEAERKGWSNDKLAEELHDAFAFSESRAEMIARTETAFADVEGNRIGWRASGVVIGQEWGLSSDPCPECVENAEAGIIGLDQEFPNGGPPAHPRCECDAYPVTSDEQAEEMET